MRRPPRPVKCWTWFSGLLGHSLGVYDLTFHQQLRFVSSEERNILSAGLLSTVLECGGRGVLRLFRCGRGLVTIWPTTLILFLGSLCSEVSVLFCYFYISMSGYFWVGFLIFVFFRTRFYGFLVLVNVRPLLIFQFFRNGHFSYVLLILYCYMLTFFIK